MGAIFPSSRWNSVCLKFSKIEWRRKIICLADIFFIYNYFSILWIKLFTLFKKKSFNVYLQAPLSYLSLYFSTCVWCFTLPLLSFVFTFMALCSWLRMLQCSLLLFSFLWFFVCVCTERGNGYPCWNLKSYDYWMGS